MRTLGLVSLVQLALNVLGLRRALERKLVPDLPGSPKRRKKDIAERAWVDGTALSAPAFMLVLQCLAALVALFGRGPGRLAARTLGVLGVMMVFGYPLERVWRESFVAKDKQLLPFTFGGFVVALTMAILGFAVRRR